MEHRHYELLKTYLTLLHDGVELHQLIGNSGYSLLVYVNESYLKVHLTNVRGFVSSGIGDRVYSPELEDIASRPSFTYVFQEDSYSALPHIKNALAYRTCDQGVGASGAPPTVVG